VADKRLFLLYVPILASLVFWFLTAPDPRFLGVIPVLYLLLSFLICMRLNGPVIEAFHESPVFSKPFIKIIFCFGLGLLCIKQLGLRSVSLNGWVAIPQPVLQQSLTKQNMPVYTAQTNGQCWNAPLPCAAAFDRALRVEWHSFGLIGAQLGLGRFVFSVRER
jgi:hypothetical protein